MSDVSSIISIIIAGLTLLVLCILWQQLSAIRYQRSQHEDFPRKWYHLFGELNNIGFWVKVVAIVLLGLMFFVCLHYLCITYPHRTENDLPDMDYLGVIITFFALLVTILVGWNIYSTIDVKTEMDKFRSERGKALKDSKEIAELIVNKSLESYNHQLKSELHLIQGLNLTQRGRHEDAFKNFLSALEHQNLCEEATHKEEIIEYLSFEISQNVQEWLSQSRLQRAIELVSASKAVGSGDLLRRLASIDSSQLRPV